ncbi:MAG: hypothetical protein IJH94_06550, partial [Clostridia bacterium]|nr:hypothetical protein [Clostridia bacterium]
MDYNEIRRKKKGKNKELLRIIITRLLLVICAGIVAFLIIKLLIPNIFGEVYKVNNTIPTQIAETSAPAVADLKTTTPVPREVTEVPQEPPVSGRGSMEPIPADVWQSMQGRSWVQNPNVG